MEEIIYDLVRIESNGIMSFTCLELMLSSNKLGMIFKFWVGEEYPLRFYLKVFLLLVPKLQMKPLLTITDSYQHLFLSLFDNF